MYFCELKNKFNPAYRKPYHHTMATDKQNTNTGNALENAKQALENQAEANNLQARLKSNRGLISGLAIFVAALLAGGLAWYFIAQNGNKKANEAAAAADTQLIKATMNTGIDSAVVAQLLPLYQKAAQEGYAAGNRSQATVGILLYEQGKYQEALEAFEKADLDDHLIAAGVQTRIGDCYVNLNKNDEALKAYDKAIKIADKNPEVVPFILVKKANIYREIGNYEQEAEAYETIMEDYPQYAANEFYPGTSDGAARPIQKYYEAAKARAGK